MNLGDLYNEATSKYQGMSFNDQAALSGFQNGGTDESGQQIWARTDGQGLQPNTDAGQTLDQLVHSGTKFDTQGFFNQLGVVPMNPQLGVWDANTARSYGFPDDQAILTKMTGPGQFTNDPQLGKVWVPQNRNFQTWDKSFVGATARGGGLFGALNKFADSGGLVKLLGGAVLGAGAGDIFHGGVDSFGNIMNGTAGGSGGYQPADFGDAGSLNDVSNYTSPPAGSDFTPGTFDGADAAGNSGPVAGEGVTPTPTGGAIPSSGLQQLQDMLTKAGLSPSSALSAAQKLLSSGGAGGGGALANIFNSDGTLNTGNALQAGGGALASILGAVNASNTRSEYNGIADKYFNVGKPYRDELTRTFTDPNYLANSPGYTGALDQTMQSYLRKASVGGNPFANPGVTQDILTGVNNSTALPYLSSTRNTLTSAGGLGLAQAGQANMAGAVAGSNILGSLGAGVSTLTQPQPKTLADLLAQWNGTSAAGASPSVPNPNSTTTGVNYDAGQNLTNNPAMFNTSGTDYGSSEGYDLSKFGLV